VAQGERLICASDALIDGGAGVRFEVRRAGGLLPAFAIRFRGSVHAYVNECRHQSSTGIPVSSSTRSGYT